MSRYARLLLIGMGFAMNFSFFNTAKPMRAERRDLILHYQEEAKRSALPWEFKAFPCVAKETLHAHIEKHVNIYSHTVRLMAHLTELTQQSPILLALFAPDGVLLKQYGGKTVVQSFRDYGIARGTLWSLDKIGPNAVSVGLAESKPLYSVGKENYCSLLQEYAIYFSPVIIHDKHEPDKQDLLGGIALIVPAALHNMDYMLTTFSVSTSLNLHIYTLDMLHKSYQVSEGAGQALLFFDINNENGKIYLAHHSQNVAQLLGIQIQELYYRPIQELIDPLPANLEFWTIIHEQRGKVSELSLPLQIQGKKFECIITTEPYNQPRLNVRGIIAWVATPKSASEQISRKIGNSAVCTFYNIIGKSQAIQSVMQKGEMLARTDSNVMLLGESGVGKDIFAQAIHNTSDRRRKPFIVVNCGALPRDLIASELFGYASGAFTGAKRQGNLGKFELANGGTIFLDEIGELPLDLQATLLRVVEQKQFMPVGSNKTIDVDVKIISATNQDLPRMIEQKHFRSDLYYRLSTMTLGIPPLRERGEDILLLAEHFIRTISERIGRQEKVTLSAASRRLLMELTWPGNVRELQNVIEGIVQLYPDSVIKPEHILENINVHAMTHPKPAVPMATEPGRPYRRSLLTTDEIRDALDACGGNRSEAARYLGIARKTLYRNMERLGM